MKTFFINSLDLLKKNGFFGFFDIILYFSIRTLRRIFYRWNGSHFGFKEAFYWSKQIDKWYRYNAVLKKIIELIENNKTIYSILEVGCGREGLAEFYPYLKGRAYHLYSLDVALPQKILRRKYHQSFNSFILGDGCKIPFKDNKIDFVISIDTLEHIPKSKRSTVIQEMIRVAKYGVFITCPLQSIDNKFVGEDYDIKYQQWYTKYFKAPNPTVTEHLQFGIPSVEDLFEILPILKIEGILNAEGWFKCMTLSGRPFIGLLTGFWFLLFLKSKAHRPPYYGGLIYFDKINDKKSLSNDEINKQL